MLAAVSRRVEKTSTLYIIRMSRKAFFPLGGYFVENSLTCCEPCRSWRRATADLPGCATGAEIVASLTPFLRFGVLSKKNLERL
jgi:hypothetical protein